MTLRPSSAIVAFVLLVACAAGPTAVEPPAAAPAAAAAEPVAADGRVPDKAAEQPPEKQQEQKQAERRKQEKELRGKQRELVHTKVEQQIADLERRSRTMGVEAALERSVAELEAARRQLDVFLQDEKPRELEGQRLSLDGSTYRAEESKDELGELTAMYEADEFARTTKELVLKRGRRQMEMANRRLAIETREVAHFEQFELPRRERELRHKVADAELAHKKAESEVAKARLELDLAAQRMVERQADLEEEIRELQQALAKDAP